MLTHYIITCPVCKHCGSETDFAVSLADEAWCPACEIDFVLDDEEDE